MERTPEQTRNPELQEIWDRKVKEELQADRKKEQSKEAKSLEKYIRADVKKYAAKRKKTGISPYKLTIQQYEAFQWCRWGVPQDVAAEIIGISQSAYSQRLARLFERYPELEPTKENWLMRPDPIDPKKKARPTIGKTDTDEIGGTFTEAGHGYHIPNKIWWPKIELKFDKEDEKREERRLKRIDKEDEEPELQPMTDLDKALRQLPEDTYNR